MPSSISPDVISRLGVEKDSDIAKSIGVSREYIRQVRSKHGVGRFRVELPEEVCALLGKVPDYQIAKEANISTWLITKRRRELGIPAARGSGRGWGPGATMMQVGWEAKRFLCEIGNGNASAGLRMVIQDAQKNYQNNMPTPSVSAHS